MPYRIVKFVKSYGLVAAGRHVLGRVGANVCPPVRQVFCAHLAEFRSSPKPEAPSIRVQPFQSLSEILPALLEELFTRGTIDNRRPSSRETATAFLKWLFSRGAVFWVCYENNVFVGYLWSLRGSQEVPRFHFFPLGAQDAVFLAHEIFPDCRGRELNRKMTNLVLGEMKSYGVERVYVDVLLTNKRSLQSFAKTPFLPIGRARMKNFKKRQVVVWRKPRPTAEFTPGQKG